jgi:uncharacterized membrane protein
MIWLVLGIVTVCIIVALAAFFFFAFLLVAVESAKGDHDELPW